MTTATRDERRAQWERFVGPTESRSRAVALGSAAAGLMLIGSFLNFLNYNGYPLGRVEVALDLIALGLGALVVGLVGTALGMAGRLVIPLLLVVLAVDFNSDAFLPLLISPAVALVAIRFVRQALILLFGVVVVAALWSAATGGAGGGQASMTHAVPPIVAGQQMKPDLAIIHLILDEHIGIEGIPDSVPKGPEARERLRQFYLGHGFHIFGGAYSESLHTYNAIPRALSLGIPRAWQKGGRSGVALTSNLYFDKLQSMGLHIEVAQTDWLDYCDHPAVVACATRPAGSLIDVGDALPASDKAAILIYRFAALSGISQNALAIYDLAARTGRRSGYDLPLVQLLQRTITSTLNGMATFEDVIGAARSITPGKALFAHVLLPHYPYVYDPACGIRRVSKWLGRRSAVAWETRYAAYFDQVQCATAKVAELLAAVGQSPAAGKTVIIIHGDHGSRIMHMEPTVENDGKFSGRDLVDGHAAFFAVLAPGIGPGYDKSRYPLRILLDALVESNFRSSSPVLPSGFVPTIAIEDHKGNPVYERNVHDAVWWGGASDEQDD